MFTNQPGRETIAFAFHLELNEQTLPDVARAATDRVQAHDRLPRFFDFFFSPAAHRGNFLIGRIQSAVRVEIANDDYRSIADFLFDRTHMKLPLEVIGERRRPRQKLFEGWGVSLVFYFLSFIARVEVVLKLPAKIDLFKRIARSLFTDNLVANRVDRKST